MPLDINGYSDNFRMFTEFARQHIDAGRNAAIANVAGVQGKKVSSLVASETDKAGFWGALNRNQAESKINDLTRKLFLNSVSEMFGGFKNIPASVMDAIKFDDYAMGKPLTARRIMAVKEAIDLNGVARERAASLSLNKFASPETRQAALDLGYTKAELPRVARSVNLMMAATGCTAEEALREVSTPGSKANRLTEYGGRFVKDAASFANGLRLLDSFSNWYTTVRSEIEDVAGANGAYTDEVANTATKLNIGIGVLANDSRAGLERFIFEELASNPKYDLSSTNPEELFGFANNPAARFAGRGYTEACSNTILAVPPEKRRIVYAAFDVLAPLAKNAAEANDWDSRGNQRPTLNSANASFTLGRVLRHLGEIEKLAAKGKLDERNLLKTCFPDIRQNGSPAGFAINKLCDDIAEATTLAGDEGEYSDLDSGLITVTLDSTGGTLREVATALRGGKPLPNVPYYNVGSLPMSEIDLGTTGGRSTLGGDLGRPSNYGVSGGEKNILGGDCGFGIKFPGEGKLLVNGTKEGQVHIPTVLSKVENFCGKVHARQASAVMTVMSQSGMDYLRQELKQYGVECDEHAAIDMELSRDDTTGAVTIKYTSPQELPFRFEWSATVDVKGGISRSPLVFKNGQAQMPTAEAERFVRQASDLAKQKGLKLNAGQLRQATSLMTHFGATLPESRRALFASFLVNLKLTDSAGIPKTTLDAAKRMAREMSKWRDFDFGFSPVQGVCDAFMPAQNKILMEGQTSPSSQKSGEDIDSIFEADVSRCTYRLGDKTFKFDAPGTADEKTAAVVEQFKKMLPPGVMRKAISAVMCQTSSTDLANFTVQNRNIDGVELHHALGTEMFATSKFDGVQRSMPLAMQKDTVWELDISPDGKTATVTLNHNCDLTTGELPDVDNHLDGIFGEVTIKQKMTIDISGDAPVLKDVSFAQKFEAPKPVAAPQNAVQGAQ
ncbi:MAG: hypothetical protein IJJ33_13080 [Victivallales bacterium]|nr:hypothetical protein [Victivallales bacterium]